MFQLKTVWIVTDDWNVGDSESLDVGGENPQTLLVLALGPSSFYYLHSVFNEVKDGRNG